MLYLSIIWSLLFPEYLYSDSTRIPTLIERTPNLLVKAVAGLLFVYPFSRTPKSMFTIRLVLSIFVGLYWIWRGVLVFINVISGGNPHMLILSVLVTVVGVSLPLLLVWGWRMNDFDRSLH